MPVPAIKILINERNMAGNPVIARLWTSENQSARFIVRLLQQIDPEWDGEILYSGEVYSDGGWATVDLSSIFINRNQTAGASVYFISLYDISTGNEYEHQQFTVYAGGVSKLMLRELMVTPGTSDIFSVKLKNIDANFLLTTRTNDYFVFIPEGEIMPLYYYAKGLKFTIKANDISVLERDHSADEQESIQFIDIKELRNNVAFNHNILASEFRVVNDNGWSFTIVIINSAQSKYSLKFRNSFRVFEKINLSDTISFLPEFNQADKYSSFDNGINDFKLLANRKIRLNRLTGFIPITGTDRNLFILDLLHSEEVYLLSNEREFRCNISAEELTLSTNNIPYQLPINIELIDSENHYTPVFHESFSLIMIDSDNLSSNNIDIVV